MEVIIMKKIKIRDREYNCSNAVYWHIQGLETENRLFSQEIHAHERSEIKIMYENENLERHNKQLKDKITKAKEYMRDNMSLREYTEHYMNLMLILKGDSNE